MKEITFEITDFCPHECGFCSSNASRHKNNFLSPEVIKEHLRGKVFDVINISGGEPLAHPDFYFIHQLCKKHLTENGVVVVYTNTFQAIAYNATVLPGGVRVICNLPLHENVDEVRALKLVEHGRARQGGPLFKSSKNFGDCQGEKENTCTCNSTVILASGKIAPAACHKDRDLKENL